MAGAKITTVFGSEKCDVDNKQVHKTAGATFTLFNGTTPTVTVRRKSSLLKPKEVMIAPDETGSFQISKKLRRATF